MDASEYYKIRLEHTLQQVQQATRLIYFVSGAIVAMLYFVIEKMKDIPSQLYLGIGLLLLLGSVNIIHAQIIWVQGQWYRSFDERLSESVGVERVTRKRTFFNSTNLWSLLHWIIAFAAFAAAGCIWWLKAQL